MNIDLTVDELWDAIRELHTASKSEARRVVIFDRKMLREAVAFARRKKHGSGKPGDSVGGL